MDLNVRIYVAGHRGLAGSAISRRLAAAGYRNLISRTHAELELADALAVKAFFETERPECAFLAAAKVGGVLANHDHPAEFIHSNLAVQTNVIHEAWCNGAKRLLFLGSSCIYPRHWFSPRKLSLVVHQYDAVASADALALVTEWKPFRLPNFGAMKKAMKQPVIFDGRN